MKQSLEILQKNLQSFVNLKNSRNVILVRHGQSIGNALGLIVGQQNWGLSDVGFKECKVVAPVYLNFLNNFTKIYTSDLKRSMQTMKECFNNHPDLKYIADKRLRELHFGDDEGKEITKLIPKENDSYKAPNGESWDNVYTRTIDFFKELQHPGNYIVFSHGGLISKLMVEFGQSKSKEVLTNVSAVAFKLDQNTSLPIEKLWLWEFPIKPSL